MNKEELYCELVAIRDDGARFYLSVYRRGSTVTIQGPNGFRHVCQRPIRSPNDLKNEVSVVFNAKIEETTSRSQIIARTKEADAARDRKPPREA